MIKKTDFTNGSIVTTEEVDCFNDKYVICTPNNYPITSGTEPNNKVAGNFCNSPKDGTPVNCKEANVLNGDFACAVFFF